MHTITMIAAGLTLLAVFVLLGWLMGSGVGRLAQVFIPVWLVVAIGNMLVGMFAAGIPFLTEIVVLIAVFGVPALVAWYIGRRYRTRPAE